MFLIDDILLAPLKGVIWMDKKINEVIEKELFDEGLVKEKLMELQMRFELGEVTEEDFRRREEELLTRLDAIQGSREGVNGDD